MTVSDRIHEAALRVMSDTAPCIQQRRRLTAPHDTGELAGSIDVINAGRTAPFRYELQATQDGTVAPHGAIINNPSGGRITARSGGALGPFNHAGQTMFRRSVEQSVVHRGWWDERFDWEAELLACFGRSR